MVGVDCHIGSQLTETQPFLDALEKLLTLIDQLASDGIVLHHIDIGGGLGVTYDSETPPSPGDYISKVVEWHDMKCRLCQFLANFLYLSRLCNLKCI